MTKRTMLDRAAAISAVVTTTALSAAGPALAKPAKHHRARSTTLTGIVVHHNDPAHSFVIADHAGHLDAIHGRLARVGERVRVRAHKLANGTFAEDRLTELTRPRSHDLRIQGIVSAENPSRHLIVVSVAGSSIPVQDDASSSTPVGEAVDLQAHVEPHGSLTATSITDIAPSQAFKIEGKVLAVDPSTRTLTVSADDDAQTGDSVRVSLPVSFELTAFHPGDVVELTVTKDADGSFSAVQSFGDDNVTEADDHGHGRGRGGPVDDRSGHDDDRSGHHDGGSGTGGGSAGHDGRGTAGSPGSSDSAPHGSGGSGSHDGVPTGTSPGGGSVISSDTHH